MIGLVIVTHGLLADEFVAAMEHVVGPQKLVETVCIGPEDNMETRRQDIIAAVAAAEMGDGVIVLTDMFGGTPSNLAISILEEANIEVIAGVNLPLLVKLASVRKSSDMAVAVSEACEAGRKYIKLASNVLDVSAG
jgi:PTS system mannose-specific IIA component